MKHRKHPGATPDEKAFFSHSGKQLDIQSRTEESFFQPKLTMGRPGDAFEQEADAVVNQSQAASTDRVQEKKMVQRQAPEEEEEVAAKLQRQETEEEEPVQMQVEEEEEPVQARGMEEKEEVSPKLQRQELEEEEEGVQAKLELQRQAEEEEEPIQMQAEEEELQAKSQDGGSSLASRLKSRRGQGNPLPPKTQAEMEGALGADFSGVRVHTDEEAVQMSQQLQAQAFTNGRDVYFNEGKFSPESRSGRHLLAHELTHVVQQSENKP